MQNGVGLTFEQFDIFKNSLQSNSSCGGETYNPGLCISYKHDPKIAKAIFAVAKGYKTLKDISLFTGVDKKELYCLIYKYGKDYIHQAGRIIYLSDKYDHILSVSSYFYEKIRMHNCNDINSTEDLAKYIADCKDNCEREILKAYLLSDTTERRKEKKRRKIIYDCFRGYVNTKINLRNTIDVLKKDRKVFKDVLTVDMNKTIKEVIDQPSLEHRIILQACVANLNFALSHYESIRKKFKEEKICYKKCLRIMLRIAKTTYVQNLVKEFKEATK
jgi:hypothetical protein